MVADTYNRSLQMQQDVLPSLQHSETRLARLVSQARFSTSVETLSSTARMFVLLLKERLQQQLGRFPTQQSCVVLVADFLTARKLRVVQVSSWTAAPEVMAQ